MTWNRSWESLQFTAPNERDAESDIYQKTLKYWNRPEYDIRRIADDFSVLKAL